MTSPEERAAACVAHMLATDDASRALGMSVEATAPGRARVSLVVTRAMANGFGICHGGIIFSLADSAFAFACNTYDDLSVAAAASIEFLKSANVGDRLTADARERQRGRRSGIYDVSVTNADGEEIAVFRGRSASLGRPLLPRAT
jgi:acyl-CoA thioesterase